MNENIYVKGNRINGMGVVLQAKLPMTINFYKHIEWVLDPQPHPTSYFYGMR